MTTNLFCLLNIFLLLPVHASTTQEEKTRTNWSIWDLYQELECESEHHMYDNNADAFPNHNMTVWKSLRDAYRQIVGKASSLPSTDDELSGFQVASEIRKTTARGRGNYADQDIPKDTLVWKSRYTAQFALASDYRAFLKAISPQFACDVILWAYTRNTFNGDVVVCVDLDPGSFTNNADTEEELNMQLGNSSNKFEDTGCYLEYYSSRDIPNGEELLIDYGFSLGGQGWITMGLLPLPWEENGENKENEEENWNDDEGDWDDDNDDSTDKEKGTEL